MRASDAILASLVAAGAGQGQAFTRSRIPTSSPAAGLPPKLVRSESKHVSQGAVEAQPYPADLREESIDTRKTAPVLSSGGSSGGMLRAISTAGTLRGGGLFGKSAVGPDGEGGAGGRTRRFFGGGSTTSTMTQSQIEKTLEENHINISARRLAGYMSVWYLARTVHKIASTKMMFILNMPATVSAAHNATGSVVALVLWAFRVLRVRDVSGAGLKALTGIAACQLVGDLCEGICPQDSVRAVAPMVFCKAGEPLVVALFSALCLRQMFSFPTYASLVLVAIGVGLLPTAELLVFSTASDWPLFLLAATSTIASAMTTTISKRQLRAYSYHDHDDDGGSQAAGKIVTPSPSGMNAGVTILSALLCMPLAVSIEIPWIEDELWFIISDVPYFTRLLVYNTLLGGLALYVYHEMWFRILQVLSPVAHTVASNMSVFVIDIISAIYFGVKVRLGSVIGAFIASGGVALFHRASSSTQEFPASTATTATATATITNTSIPKSILAELQPYKVTDDETVITSQSMPAPKGTAGGVGSSNEGVNGGG